MKQGPHQHALVLLSRQRGSIDQRVWLVQLTQYPLHRAQQAGRSGTAQVHCHTEIQRANLPTAQQGAEIVLQRITLQLDQQLGAINRPRGGKLLVGAGHDTLARTAGNTAVTAVGSGRTGEWKFQQEETQLRYVYTDLGAVNKVDNRAVG